MNWDVISVAVKEHLVLWVRFKDGMEGEVRILPPHLTGVFAPLIDPQFFKQVSVQGGAVTWPSEIDLAPDAMYEAIKKHGCLVLA